MAMKYGLARNIQVYNIDTHEGAEVVSTTGDYLHAHMWMKDHVNDFDEETRDVLQAYVWAYFAVKRAGLLDKFDLPEKLTKDGLFKMADCTTIFLDTIDDGSLPLARSEKQPNR